MSELSAEWIKIPDGNGGFQKCWIRDSAARNKIATLQTDVSGKQDALSTAQLNAVNSGITAAKVATYDAISVPTASTASPQMDGTASAGSSSNWSRGDHVHPSDTSKQDALSTAQLNAVNSGITAAKVATYDAINVPTNVSAFNNDAGYLTSAPVTSVNSQTGVVTLDASDVGALPDSTSIPSKTSDLTNDSGFVTDNFFGEPTAISSGDDLNNYTTPGHYSANTGTVAGSLSNCPVSSNFSLFVIWRTDSLKSQMLIPASKYFFLRYASSSGWSSWYRFSGTAV